MLPLYTSRDTEINKVTYDGFHEAMVLGQIELYLFINFKQKVIGHVFFILYV